MRWLPAVIVVAAFAATALFYPSLPDTIPVHWNFEGEADRTAPKFPAALLLPVITLLVAGLFAALPRMSPKGFSVDPRSRGFRAITIVSLAALLALHIVTLAASAGAPVDVGAVVPMIVGLLFVVTGNYLSTLTRNFWIGIRTPWTLASDEVWFRTHRLGGRLFMAGGVVLMFTGFLEPRGIAVVLTAVIAAAVVVPIVYSYAVSRS
ncbi:MAG TPA: SdpI family protein [Thermoanaerobaculia bacterium]